MTTLDPVHLPLLSPISPPPPDLALGVGGAVIVPQAGRPWLAAFGEIPEPMTATLVSCMIATLLFGLGPAWRISGGVATTLKESAGGYVATTSRAARALLAPRNLLIVAQVALSLALLTAGGLFLRGAVEVAPRLKLAQVICDLVSTGATLEANGLEPIETVLRSEAVLIRSPAPLGGDHAHLADSLVQRFRGVTASRGAKYVMMNAPHAVLPQIASILPGADAPTVTPLAGRDDAVAVHAVCQESVFWETLEQLKAAGASAILVLPIEKMM